MFPSIDKKDNGGGRGGGWGGAWPLRRKSKEEKKKRDEREENEEILINSYTYPSQLTAATVEPVAALLERLRPGLFFYQPPLRLSLPNQPER